MSSSSSSFSSSTEPLPALRLLAPPPSLPAPPQPTGELNELSSTITPAASTRAINKLTLFNVPKSAALPQLTKRIHAILAAASPAYDRSKISGIRAIPNKKFCQITFGDCDDVYAFLEAVRGKDYDSVDFGGTNKGDGEKRTLTCEMPNAENDRNNNNNNNNNNNKKRGRDDNDNNDDNANVKEARVIQKVLHPDKIRDQLTPMWREYLFREQMPDRDQKIAKKEAYDESTAVAVKKGVYDESTAATVDTTSTSTSEDTTTATKIKQEELEDRTTTTTTLTTTTTTNASVKKEIPNYQPYAIYRKTTLLKRNSLHKVIKEIKGSYRIKREDRNRQIKKNDNGKNKQHAIPNEIITPAWLEVGGMDSGVEFKEFVKSPKNLFYRNKCEMSCGLTYVQSTSSSSSSSSASSSSTEDIYESFQSSGCLPQGWDGPISPVSTLHNLPSMITIVTNRFNSFLKDKTKLKIYDVKEHLGVWRQLMVRVSRRSKEVMVVVMHNDYENEDAAVFEEEKKMLTEWFMGADGTGAISGDAWDYNDDVQAKDRAGLNEYDSKVVEVDKYMDSDYRGYTIKSLYLQSFTGLSAPSASHPFQLVSGRDVIHESLMGCKFEVSPGAFFQVNTEGAELLYGAVIDEVKLLQEDQVKSKIEDDDGIQVQVQDEMKEEKVKEKTLILDVCCGTGTIGIVCLKAGVCSKIIGIDIAPMAITDAKRNLALNGFDATVAEYICDKAENGMTKILSSGEVKGYKNVVAILDPAREGCHPDVLKALRSASYVKTIIYISCNPTKSLPKDAAVLCGAGSKTVGGKAFQVKSMRGVDMFPLTEHCEGIMVFQR